jgi:hypothetical protein
MAEFQPFGPKLPHDPEGILEHERDVRERAERAHDVKRASTTAHRSSLGYAIVFLGAALFVASCFLPYVGYPVLPARGEQTTISLYQQLSWRRTAEARTSVRCCICSGHCPRCGRRGCGPCARRATPGAARSVSGRRRGLVAHLDRRPTAIGHLRLFAGDRLLAAGSEHRRGGHRNHPGRYSTEWSPRAECGGPGRVRPDELSAATPTPGRPRAGSPRRTPERMLAQQCFRRSTI